MMYPPAFTGPAPTVHRAFKTIMLDVDAGRKKQNSVRKNSGFGIVFSAAQQILPLIGIGLELLPGLAQFQVDELHQAGLVLPVIDLNPILNKIYKIDPRRIQCVDVITSKASLRVPDFPTPGLKNVRIDFAGAADFRSAVRTEKADRTLDNIAFIV